MLDEISEGELVIIVQPTAIQLSNTVVDVLFASGSCLTLPESHQNNKTSKMRISNLVPKRQNSVPHRFGFK